MGNLEEPGYQQFDGTCRDCGKKHTYYSSIKRHPDQVVCPECEEAAKAVTS